MSLLLLAAHEGEEFVIILPVLMGGAAFVLMKWGFGSEGEAEAESAVREEAVQPPDERHPGDDPGGNHEVQRARERVG